MSSRLIMAISILCFNATPLYAQEMPLASLLLEAEEKPIPLFPSAPSLGEQAAQTPSQPTIPTIVEEKSVQEATSSPIQPSAEQHPTKPHQAVLKTENVQSLQPDEKGSSAAVVAPTQDIQAPDLQVLEFVLANRVVNGEPQEVLETFTIDAKRAAAFARLQATVNTEVTFLWYRNNQEYMRYKTPVRATKQWRSFSSVTLHSGDWKVQLLGKNNEVLAEKTFSIK